VGLDVWVWLLLVVPFRGLQCGDRGTGNMTSASIESTMDRHFARSSLAYTWRSCVLFAEHLPLGLVEIIGGRPLRSAECVLRGACSSRSVEVLKCEVAEVSEDRVDDRSRFLFVHPGT
jgi:hypothetical protein